MKKKLVILVLVLTFSFVCYSGCNKPIEKDDENIPQKNGNLLITSPIQGEEVYLYKDFAKEYILSPYGSDVSLYSKNGEDGYQGVEIKWENTYENVKNFLVEWSLSSDFANAESETVSGRMRSLCIDNLFKSTEYFVRVTAHIENSEDAISTTSFKTSSSGPRPLKINGIRNVRDLGGYMTESGKTTQQGIIYRGGSLSSTKDYPTIALTDAGKKYMSNVLNIKFDMDLRGKGEGGVEQSPIPGAKVEWFGVNGYASAFDPGYKDRYCKVFQTLSVKDNYPLYMHCTGGADRTGTIAFLYLALLGVSESDIIHDYEFTSFSVYTDRNTRPDTVYGAFFAPFREGFDKYKGKTLSEKAENYLLSIGLTETEIYNIKAIAFGEPCKVNIFAQKRFNIYNDDFYIISVNGGKNIEKVVLNEKEVEFNLSDGNIRIPASSFPSDIIDGTIDGFCVIDGIEYPFSVEIDSERIVSGFDFSNGNINLDMQNAKIETTDVIGYNDTRIQFHLDKYSVKDSNHGCTYFMIGSYGVKARGGSLRMAFLDKNNKLVEISPRNEYIVDIRKATLGLSLSIKDEKTITLKIYINNNLGYTYDFSRVSNEIVAENAKGYISLESVDNTDEIILSEKSK